MINQFFSNLKKQLLKASDALSKIPSLGWGLSYFLVILIFAFVYMLNSDGFYHSTSQFEKSLEDDAKEILSSLESSLISSSNFSPGAYEGWTLVEDKFYVHSLKAFDDKIGFSVHTLFEKDRKMTGMGLELYFSLNEELVSCADGADCFSTHILQTVRPIFDKENDFLTLIPQVLSFYGDINWIETPVTLDEKIKSYVSAHNGFPSESSGGFGRMLYFSVVTITTLGYGDIVPVSDLNRFLVGFESVLGLIIIGLFLNSLSRERREEP